ncbi:MAG: hypothetical protein EOP47_11790 [Sphingobacteriaceae bacterium]|nr:MAG: hypothetical protein EOP47_11790 [Sphingobacteriaceae bacterium]
MYKLRLIAGLALALFTSLLYAEVPVPPLTQHVVDTTSTLNEQQITQIEDSLRAFEALKGSQIAVLIISTTQSEAIEQYGIRVAEQWKLGRKNIDDGAILIVAKDDRTLRIEVGYGLEGALNDATAKRIIEEIIVPQFKAGDFYNGIRAGTEQIMKVVEGEALPAAEKNNATSSGERDINF